ncbi:helix-turn-helix domain-containing protein [Streptosporangium sp. NPDC051022]|uniref:helix-turn-helix domain-containing protein n=1 Tax=Streptosporangium sp. NPDC051022 TaxID=3155752 RepID=UPI0034131DCE
MSTKKGRRVIDRAAVARRYEAGQSIRQIATEVGCSHTAVHRALQAARVALRRPGGPPGSRVSEERKAEILAAYRGGDLITDIMIQWRVSDVTIAAIAQEAGEPRRGRGARRRLDWEQVGRLAAKGWPPDAIAILVDASEGHIKRILRRLTEGPACLRGEAG